MRETEYVKNQLCAPFAPKYILAPQNAPQDCLQMIKFWPKVRSGLHQNTLSARKQKKVFVFTSIRLPRLRISANFRQNARPERSLLPNFIPRFPPITHRTRKAVTWEGKYGCFSLALSSGWCQGVPHSLFLLLNQTLCFARVIHAAWYETR